MFLVSGVLLIGASYFVGEATMNLFRPLGYISWAMSVIFGLIGSLAAPPAGAPADDDR